MELNNVGLSAQKYLRVYDKYGEKIEEGNEELLAYEPELPADKKLKIFAATQHLITILLKFFKEWHVCDRKLLPF